MTTLSPLLEEVLQKLPLTDVRLQNLVSSHYRKCFPGNGIEFEELQQYKHGDDIRSIDWKSSSRLHEIFVRKYTEAFDNKILFAIDTSSSMNSLDEQGNPKLKSLLAVSLILAKTALLNGDKVGFMYKNHSNYVSRPFTHLRNSLVPELSNIEKTIQKSYFEENNWEEFFDYLTTHVKEKSICFIISDNFDFGLKTISKLKRASLKHKLLLIEISSWFDELEPFMLPAVTTDIETGEGYEYFLDNPTFIAKLRQEKIDASKQVGINVSVPARYVKISDDNKTIYDVIKLLSLKQRKFSKTIVP